MFIDRIDNSWLAVPLIVDFRVLRYNHTTFKECKKRGVDIDYPPVITYNIENNKELYIFILILIYMIYSL